jgi:hypothetical protein
MVKDGGDCDQSTSYTYEDRIMKTIKNYLRRGRGNKKED